MTREAFPRVNAHPSIASSVRDIRPRRVAEIMYLFAMYSGSRYSIDMATHPGGLPKKIELEEIPSRAGSSVTCRHFRLPHFPFAWHYHPQLELTLIVQGHGLRFVGDSIDNYAEGDVCLLGANLPHSWQSVPEAGAVHSLVVQFTADGWAGAFRAVPELSRVAHVVEVRCRRGLHLTGATASEVSRIMEEIPAAELASTRRLTLLLEALDHIARASPADAREISTTDVRVGEHHDQAGKLKRVLDRLDASLGGELPRQAELADLAGVTPAAFSRLFKRAFGRTYVDYLNAWRVGIACRLLLNEPNLAIADVARRAGFDNLSNFHRRFLAAKRITPRRFKELVSR